MSFSTWRLLVLKHCLKQLQLYLKRMNWYMVMKMWGQKGTGMMLRISRTIQVRKNMQKGYQKTVWLPRGMALSSIFDSKRSISRPSGLTSISQRIPTSFLPEMFLVKQKSMAPATISSAISFIWLVRRGSARQRNTTPILMAMWSRAMMGWAVSLHSLGILDSGLALSRSNMTLSCLSVLANQSGVCFGYSGGRKTLGSFSAYIQITIQLPPQQTRQIQSYYSCSLTDAQKHASISQTGEQDKGSTNQLNPAMMLPRMKRAAALAPYCERRRLTLSLCTLLHLQQEFRLKPSRAAQKAQMVIWVNRNFRILMTSSTIQMSAKRMRVHQKALSLAPELFLSSTLHQNFHCSLPSSSKSIHHLRPTSSRPAMFLTIQKSTAARMTTKMSWLELPGMSRGRTRQMKTRKILRRMCSIATPG